MIRRSILMLGLIVFASILTAQFVRAQTISFRLTAVNPSNTKTQAVNVKGYLPKEAHPENIVDLSGLELAYDTDRGQYYVFQNSVELGPKEVRVYDIEVSDIWLVSEKELGELNDTTEGLLSLLVGTEYYPKADTIAYGIFDRIGQIRTGQQDETQTKEEHIGTFRANQIILEKIREDIERLEKIVVVAGGPIAPEMLAETEIKSDSPTRTMTWIVIFSIITFTLILGGVLFFTWQHQARVSHEALAESTREAFPGQDSSNQDL